MSADIPSLKDLEKKADYIIEYMDGVEFVLDETIKALEERNDIESNKRLFKMNHQQYFSLLDTILEKLYNSLGNKDSFIKYVKIFRDIFYLFKMDDVEKLQKYFSLFIKLTLEYDKIYLNSKKREILLKWEEVVYNYKDYTYEELEKLDEYGLLDTDATWRIFFSSELPDHKQDYINIKRALSNIIRDSYKIIRSDPEKTKEVYLLVDKIFYYFVNKDYNSFIYHRLLSLSSLKNDIALHKELNEDQIDLYVKETLYLYNNNLCFGHREGLFKVLENLAKAQFAYNLLGVDKNLKKEYKLIHNKLKETYFFWPPNFKEYLSDLQQFTKVYWQYSLFISDQLDFYKVKENIHNTMNGWAEHKNKILKEKGEKITTDQDKYNFIY